MKYAAVPPIPLNNAGLLLEGQEARIASGEICLTAIFRGTIQLPGELRTRIDENFALHVRGRNKRSSTSLSPNFTWRRDGATTFEEAGRESVSRSFVHPKAAFKHFQAMLGSLHQLLVVRGIDSLT